MYTKQTKTKAPRTLRIDKRVDAVAAQGNGSDEDLLTESQVATWFGVSTKWLEAGRSKGYGPPFIKIGDRSVRYQRGTSRDWLRGRTFTSTRQYGNSTAKGLARGGC